MDMTKINEFLDWVLAWGKKIIEKIKDILDWGKNTSESFSNATED